MCGFVGLPGPTGPVGTAPHFPTKIEENLHTASVDPEVRKCQFIWINWLKAKVSEAERQNDLHAINHWKRLLAEFIEKSKIEAYVSPFTGKLV